MTRAKRHHVIALVVWVALVIALTLWWDLADKPAWLDVAHVVGFLQTLGRDFGPLGAIGCFALVCLAGVPLLFLTLVAVVAFGPLLGGVVALTGGAAGAAASFALGRALGQRAMRQLAGDRANELSRKLANRGMMSMFAVRLVPVAPFAVVNMVAGASHMQWRDFLIGGTLGMVPGTVLIGVFVNVLLEAL